MSKQGDKKVDDALKGLQKHLDAMTPEMRESLEQAGLTLPSGDISAIATKDFKYGVRCTHCNKVALYFVGTSWTMHGEVVDYPPPLPHNRIMWTQLRDPSEIDRHTPRCQHCDAPVALQADGSFDRRRTRIVVVNEFETKRDESNRRENVRAAIKKAQGDVGADAMNLSQSYSLPDEPVSKMLDRKNGEGFSKQLEAVAEATGVTEALRTGQGVALR